MGGPRVGNERRQHVLVRMRRMVDRGRANDCPQSRAAVKIESRESYRDTLARLQHAQKAARGPRTSATSTGAWPDRWPRPPFTSASRRTGSQASARCSPMAGWPSSRPPNLPRSSESSSPCCCWPDWRSIRPTVNWRDCAAVDHSTANGSTTSSTRSRSRQYISRC